MAYVKNILDTKGREIWTTQPDATIHKALLLMAEKKVGALLVFEGEKIAGILSERDYSRRVAATNCLCLDEPVSAFMTSPIYYVSPEQTVEECMLLMTSKHVRHLPVLQNEQIVGLVSIGDVVKSILGEKETTIKGLEHYIMGHQIIQ